MVKNVFIIREPVAVKFDDALDRSAENQAYRDELTQCAHAAGSEACERLRELDGQGCADS